MFTNPFRRGTTVTAFPNEKCRYCLKRIGLENVFPIPLCRSCFSAALSDPTPEQPQWRRVCEEFDSEVRSYMRKLQSRPSMSEALQDSLEETQSIVELGRAIDAATLMGDKGEVSRLSNLMHERLDTLNSFRTDAPKLLSALDKE